MHLIKNYTSVTEFFCVLLEFQIIEICEQSTLYHL